MSPLCELRRELHAFTETDRLDKFHSRRDGIVRVGRIDRKNFVHAKLGAVSIRLRYIFATGKIAAETDAEPVTAQINTLVSGSQYLLLIGACKMFYKILFSRRITLGRLKMTRIIRKIFIF